MRKTLRKGRKADPLPIDAAAFMAQGGIRQREAAVAAQAVTTERRRCLPVLERWLKAGSLAPEAAAAIAADVKRIRRALAPPTPEQRREKTRLRVRAFRERQRHAPAQARPE